MNQKRYMTLLLLGAWAGGALCAPEPPDTLSTTLDEVSVTAVKQMSALRNDPTAVSILSGKELERLDIVSIKGISGVVPNFFMADYGSRITSSIYVRGIGARMDQPSVGLNVDNVPYLNKDAYDFDLADIASVEMLRGPQSTLYGRNTMAGVINVTTLSPMRYQGWRIMAQATSRLAFKGSAGWYHRFADNVGFSVTGAYSHARGEFKNGYNGKYLDWERNFSLRSKLHWRVSPEWSLRNTLSSGYLRQGGYPYEYKETGRIEYNDTCFYRRFTIADGLTARYVGDRFNVTSITSLQYIDDNMTLDQDFLPLDYFTITQKKRETAVTQDVVVRNNDDSGVYSWLGGIFGFYKHLDMDAPVTFKDTGIRELIEDNRNNANPSHPISWRSRSFPLNSEFTIPTWGVAAYHESVVSLGRWRITGGLRLDYERATLDYHSFCDTGYDVFRITDNGREFYRTVDIDIDDRGQLHRDFLNLLPKIAVEYELEDGLGNVYAKVSKGYKTGGFNTQMFSDVLQQRLMNIMGIGSRYDVDDIVGYKPEKSWNYEIGSHLNLFSGRVELDMAAFYIDCRDQQLTMFPDGTTTGRIMTNAGKTRSYGVEASLTYRPGERLTFTGSYGYTDARFRKFFNGIDNFKGKYLPYAPGNTLFLQALWSCPLTPGGASLAFDVNMRGVGKIYWNESNTEVQDFYALLGAGVTFSSSGFSAQLWGKNLTDTRYRTFYFMSMGNSFFQRGRGAESGITIRYNF